MSPNDPTRSNFWDHASSKLNKKNSTEPQGKSTIESQSLLAKKVVFDVFFGDDCAFQFDLQDLL
jgi:hypothetical protein